MLTYILRRVAVLDPGADPRVVPDLRARPRVRSDPARQRCLHSRDVTCIPRAEKQLGLDKSLPVQYVDFMGDFVQGNWGDEPAHRPVRRRVDPHGALGHGPARLLGHPVLGDRRDRRRRLLGEQAVLAGRLHVHRSVVRRASRCRRSGSGCSASSSSRSSSSSGSGSTEPIFYLDSEPGRPAGARRLRPRHLALPVLMLTVQIIAGWSRFQRSVDARRAEQRLHPHRARQGPAAAQGHLEARVAQLADPARHVMALDIGALFGGLIITETDLLASRAWARCFLDALHERRHRR